MDATPTHGSTGRVRFDDDEDDGEGSGDSADNGGKDADKKKKKKKKKKKIKEAVEERWAKSLVNEQGGWVRVVLLRC